jgi:hypothetical protein
MLLLPFTIDQNSPQTLALFPNRVVCQGSQIFDAVEWAHTNIQQKWGRRTNIFYFESIDDAILFKLKFAGVK